MIDRDAFTSLFFSRTIYAVNWYNIAALFAFIAYDFNLNVSGLGVAAAVFYIGVGLFQVPGGIIAAKYGARNTAIAGVLIASAAVLLTALTSDFYQLVLLRFIVGVGSAFFFAPGVTLVARTFRRESQGFGVGTFQSAFYVGGTLGLFAWSVLAEMAGWRFSLITGGALSLLGGLLIFLKVPKDELRSDFVIKAEDLRRILSNRWLVLISLELFGFGSGTFLISSFMVYYLEQSLHLSPSFAGTIGSLTPLCAIIASPLCGMIYSKTKNARLLLFSLGMLLTAALGLDAIGSVPFAAASSILAGFGSGAFTVGYLAARDSMAASVEYESLAVSWVNTIQMLAGFVSPIIFSLLVLSFGYGFAWLTGGLYTLVLISTILYPVSSKR
ncbi:MAG: MFS transporter [Candidatus Bathyarchaeia archaeon]